MTVTNSTNVMAYEGAIKSAFGGRKGVRLFNGLLADVTSDTTSGILLDLDMAWTMTKQQIRVLNPDGVSDPWVDDTNYGVVGKNQLTGEYEYSQAIVGKGFTFTQNEPIIEAIRQLQDAGVIKIGMGGTLDSHTKCFVHATVGDEYLIKDDPHQKGILFRWGHDGSASLSVRGSVTRLWCLNQISSFQQGKAWFSVRHTKSAEVKMQDLQAQVIAAVAALDAYDTAMERLMDVRITDEAFTNYVNSMIPIDRKILDKPEHLLSTGEKRSLTIARNKRAAISEVYYTSETQENLRGTAAGAFHAAVEAFDHRFSGNRGQRLLLGQDAEFKSTAQQFAFAL